MIRVRESICYFASQQASFFISAGPFISRPAVEINAERQSRYPIPDTKLRDRPGKDSSQHVSGAPLGHSRVPRCVHKGVAIRRGQNRVKSFEKDMRLPSFGRLQCNCQPVCLYGRVRHPE